MMPVKQDIDIADLKRISELIFEKYNYDFRNYAMSSFKRRVVRILEVKKLTLTSLLTKLTNTPPFIDEFVDELTVNVTEMFRDPGFWRMIREEVIPCISANGREFRIWHAGCSSGEEVLTMCIILREAGVLENASIIATDLDESMLKRAQTAAYPIKNMLINERNYADYGGSANSLVESYYQQINGQAVFDRAMLKRVSFFKHDLVVGKLQGRFDLILCRNVMIYFNEALQNEVLKSFHEHLHLNSFLAIGSKESLIWCDYANHFIAVSSDEKIYKKIK